jgi:hypothetical protein
MFQNVSALESAVFGGCCRLEKRRNFWWIVLEPQNGVTWLDCYP